MAGVHGCPAVDGGCPTFSLVDGVVDVAAAHSALAVACHEEHVSSVQRDALSPFVAYAVDGLPDVLCGTPNSILSLAEVDVLVDAPSEVRLSLPFVQFPGEGEVAFVGGQAGPVLVELRVDGVAHVAEVEGYRFLFEFQCVLTLLDARLRPLVVGGLRGRNELVLLDGVRVVAQAMVGAGQAHDRVVVAGHLRLGHVRQCGYLLLAVAHPRIEFRQCPRGVHELLVGGDETFEEGERFFVFPFVHKDDGRFVGLDVFLVLSPHRGAKCGEEDGYDYSFHVCDSLLFGQR